MLLPVNKSLIKMPVLLQNSFYVAAILASLTHPTTLAYGARATGFLEEAAAEKGNSRS